MKGWHNVCLFSCNNDVTFISKSTQIYDFCNTNKAPRFLEGLYCWGFPLWSIRESNPSPFDCEPNALPDELIPRQMMRQRYVFLESVIHLTSLFITSVNH